MSPRYDDAAGRYAMARREERRARRYCYDGAFVELFIMLLRDGVIYHYERRRYAVYAKQRALEDMLLMMS